jgi:PTS system nitrogen regulatory IIA component
MAIADLLLPERLLLGSTATSKKRALEHLSELMANADEAFSAGTVFDSLLVRERLGSTGLGYGVAIPHARHRGATDAIGAFMRLEQPVDFDAMDREPVDLVFGLLAPEECTDEHVQLLAQLAELFSDEAVRDGLRDASAKDDVLSLMRGTPD